MSEALVLPQEVGFPRPLETRSTDKYADDQQKVDFRHSIASCLKMHGRYAEAARLEDCGRIAQTFCPKCGFKKTETRVFRCGLRECPECATIEAKKLFRRILPAIKKIPPFPGWRLRHLVLTCRRTPGASIKADYTKIKIGLSRLKAYFRRKQFAGRISAVGGVEFGPKNYMAHVHMIIFAPFLNLKKIQEITGLGKPWIDIVKSARQIENATLYAVNFAECSDPMFVANMGYAIKGTRRVFTWGALYGSTKEPEREKIKNDCPCCGTRLTYRFVLKDIFGIFFSGNPPN